jgi:hypothetical protein
VDRQANTAKLIDAFLQLLIVSEPKNELLDTYRESEFQCNENY